VSLDSRAALLLLAHGVVTCFKPPRHREVNLGFSRAAPAGVAELRPVVIKPMVAVSDEPYVARQLLAGESAPVRGVNRLAVGRGTQRQFSFTVQQQQFKKGTDSPDMM
jgi:hypothetical protein